MNIPVNVYPNAGETKQQESAYWVVYVEDSEDKVRSFASKEELETFMGTLREYDPDNGFYVMHVFYGTKLNTKAVQVLD